MYDEQENLETQIAELFPEGRPDAAFDTHLVFIDEPFDITHIYFATGTELKTFSGF